MMKLDVIRYHFGPILDGLLGVEGPILSGDPLADDSRVLVDEHRRRRGRSRRVTPATLREHRRSRRRRRRNSARRDRAAELGERLASHGSMEMEVFCFFFL